MASTVIGSILHLSSKASGEEMLIIWFKRSASCQIEGCAANGTALTFSDVFQGGLKRSPMLWKICRYHLIAPFPTPQPPLLGIVRSGLQYGKILQFISVQDEMAVESLTMLVAVQIVDISGILDFVPAIGNPKPRFSKFQYQTQTLGKTKA